MHPLIEANRQEVLDVMASHGFGNLRVFGSMARNGATEQSDVDLLVDVPKNTSALTMVGIEMELQALLGCRVDLATEDMLHPFYRDRVLKEAEAL